jgi:hypothetical protein
MSSTLWLAFKRWSCLAGFNLTSIPLPVMLGKG